MDLNNFNEKTDELEIRLGSFKNGYFTSEVTSYMYNIIINMFQEAKLKKEITQETITMYNQKAGIKIKKIENNSGNITNIKKILKRRQDIIPLNLRLDLSSEEKIDSIPHISHSDISIKERIRTTFYDKQGLLKIDVTRDSHKQIKDRPDFVNTITTAKFQIYPDYYASIQECKDSEYKGLQTNPKYKNFKQTHFTAGDEEQFQEYRNQINGSLSLCNINLIQNIFADKQLFKSWEKYNNIPANAVIDTFRYLFYKFKKAIFVKIKDNKLVTFLPFSNAKYVNEWGDLIRFDNNKYKSMIDFMRYVSILQGYKNFSEKRINGLKNTWYFNNCIIRSEYPTGEGDAGVTQEINMLKTLCETRKLPDIEFFINRRDFPLLKRDGTEPYHNIFGTENKPLISHNYEKYLPILSNVTDNNYADIPMPTPEDWSRVMSKEGIVFPSNCRIYNESFDKMWEEKKNIAVFRGTSTGCGVTIDTNMRLKVSYLSSLPENKEFLDAGITKWNLRPRKMMSNKYLETIEKDTLPFGLVDQLTPEQQSNYKYIINIDGYVSAFRLSLELNMGSVILLVDSKWKMWFSSFLVPNLHYIPIKADLSDLIEKIKWCQNNDEKCKKISENARKFYNTYLRKDGILDYLQKLLCDIKNQIGNYVYETQEPLQIKNDKDIKTKIVYQIEAEFLRKPSEIELNGVINYFGKINNDLHYAQELVYYINSIKSHQRKQVYEIIKPTKMPINLKAIDIPFLNNYAITIKPDGISYNMIFTDKGVFLINDTDYKVISLDIYNELIGTIVLGEYIHSSIDSQSNLYLYDVILYKNNYYGKQSIFEKYNVLHLISYQQFEKINIHVLTLFYTKSLLENIKDAFNDMPDVKNDGILIKPINTEGIDDPTIFKWKPIEHLTIDFSTYKNIDSTYSIYTITKDNPKYLFTGTVSFPYINSVSLDSKPEIKDSFKNGMIIEYTFDKKINNFVPVRDRSDKTKANFIITVLSIWEDINKPLTNELLLDIAKIGVLDERKKLTENIEKICKFLNLTDIKYINIFDKLKSNTNFKELYNVFFDTITKINPKNLEYQNKLVKSLYEKFISSHRILPTSPLESIQVKAKQSKCGIYNYGATCYMNSIIQFLYNMKTFRKAFIKIDDKYLNKYAKSLKIIFENLSKKEGNLKPKKLMIEYKQSGKTKLENATDILLSVFFEKQLESTQQDANEFINNLFNKIGDLSLTEESDKVRNLLYNYFGFKQQIQIYCEKNRVDNNKNPSDWIDETYTPENPGTLQLTVTLDNKSIQNGLESVATFTKKSGELLEACCKHNKKPCKNFGPGEKRTRISFIKDKNPEYLIINLARMSIEFKNNKIITLFNNDKVTINKIITIKSRNIDKKGNEIIKDIKYVLDGYILYNGSGTHGHYIFIECDDSGNEKYIFNDSNVSNFTGKSQIDTNGYIFSYKKIDL